MPVDEAMEIAAQLLNLERIEGMAHGLIGSTKAIDTERRFVVAGVRENSAAAKCGLLADDAITAVGQMPIHRRLDFERALIGHRIGEPIELSIQRNGQPRTLELVLSVPDNFEERTWNTLGMRLVPLRGAEGRALHTRYRGGMRVVDVRTDGPAMRQGIRPTDVLLGMHDWETTSKDNVLYILNHAEFEKFQPLRFFILRGNETLYGYMRVNRGPVRQVSRRMDHE
jgi:serine protease Do